MGAINATFEFDCWRLLRALVTIRKLYTLLCLCLWRNRMKRSILLESHFCFAINLMNKVRLLMNTTSKVKEGKINHIHTAVHFNFIFVKGIWYKGISLSEISKL